MYDADLVLSGNKDEGTEGFEYYRVTRDTGAFIGCMVMTPVVIDGKVQQWWYTSLELKGAEKEPALSPEECLAKLIKEYKRRNRRS